MQNKDRFTSRIGRLFFAVPLSVLLFGSALKAGDAPEFKPYTEPIPGTDVKFDMLPIPAGKFVMGSPDKEPGRAADEGPQHEVSIPAFWMGKCEVTWDEYDLFAFSEDIKRKQEAKVDLSKQPETEKAADAVTRPTPPYSDPTFGLGHEKHPAICITHHAAMEYCRWISAKTGKVYRLPTEAEWEYACRAGSTTAYPFGDNPATLGEYAWYAKNSAETPHDVGQKKPNAWGLHDMIGNAAEWCLDEYDEKFYSTFKPGVIAEGPVKLAVDKKYPHVARGGSWADEAELLRSAVRKASEKNWSMRDPQVPQSIWWHTDATFVGFRLVRAVNEQDSLKGLKSKVTKDGD